MSLFNGGSNRPWIVSFALASLLLAILIVVLIHA